MIRIWLCDDDIIFLEHMKEIIEDCLTRLNRAAQIDSARSGSELLRLLVDEREPADMVFLDIDMPQMSGLDVAAKLNHLSDHVILIFMSSHDEFMIETFQFTPFRYIQKSHVAEQITAVLQAALIKADSNQNQSIVLRTSELGEMQLSLSEITYIEREHRMLAIHCINGDIIHTWSNLKDIMNTFHSDRLIQIHSGCAVNAQHVKGFVKGRNIILLKDTTQLHVSRMSIKNIQQQLSQYWRKQV